MGISMNSINLHELRDQLLASLKTVEEAIAAEEAAKVVVESSVESTEVVEPSNSSLEEDDEPISHAEGEEEYNVNDEIRIACDIISKLNINYVGKASYIDVRIKTLPPKKDGMKPYVLVKQGIYEVVVYDEEGNQLATSRQFKLDYLGKDCKDINIPMYLRKRGVGKVKNFIAQPLYMMCD